MKKETFSVFFIIAVIGLLVSLLAHIATFFGVSPQRDFLYLWTIIIAIFLVWNPAVSVKNNLVGEPQSADFWTMAISTAPRWRKLAYLLLTIYALYNFLHPAFFDSSEIDEIRALSSYCLVFYLVATMVLYHKMKEE